jgi:hypothetical protein
MNAIALGAQTEIRWSDHVAYMKEIRNFNWKN